MYCSLGSAEDVLAAGLRLNDLNLFDGTTDILMTGIHQERELETSMIKVSLGSREFLINPRKPPLNSKGYIQINLRQFGKI